MLYITLWSNQSVVRPIHPDCQEAFTSLTQIGQNIHLNDNIPNDLTVHKNDDEFSGLSDDISDGEAGFDD